MIVSLISAPSIDSMIVLYQEARVTPSGAPPGARPAAVPGAINVQSSNFLAASKEPSFNLPALKTLCFERMHGCILFFFCFVT